MNHLILSGDTLQALRRECGASILDRPVRKQSIELLNRMVLKMSFIKRLVTLVYSSQRIILHTYTTHNVILKLFVIFEDAVSFVTSLFYENNLPSPRHKML